MPKGCDFVLGSGLSATDRRLTLDYDFYASQNEKPGAILFHELMHQLVGKHNSEMIDELLNRGKEPSTEPTSPRGQKLTTLDRTYACQALCFDDVQTRCSCASCLDTNVCDDRCEDMAECTGATCDVSTGMCTQDVSEGLTACITTDAKGKSTYTWYLTEKQCSMSGCTTGTMAGSCKKFGRECPIEE
jgi:hypothetical protein